MRWSPVQGRNEKRRGKAGLSLVKRTGAEGAAEIGAGNATESVASGLLGRYR